MFIVNSVQFDLRIRASLLAACDSANHFGVKNYCQDLIKKFTETSVKKTGLYLLLTFIIFAFVGFSFLIGLYYIGHYGNEMLCLWSLMCSLSVNHTQNIYGIVLSR